MLRLYYTIGPLPCFLVSLSLAHSLLSHSLICLTMCSLLYSSSADLLLCHLLDSLPLPRSIQHWAAVIKGVVSKERQGLDGHTLYQILYNVKPDFADLCVFNMLCHCDQVRNWFWSHYVLAHCVQIHWVLSTSATECHFKSYCTHLEAWDTLKMHPWKWGGEVQIIIKAAHELWAGSQICMQHMYTEGSFP